MSNFNGRLRSLLLQCDSQTMHLSRVLATTGGAEATLCTLYYGLLLVRSQLERMLEDSFEKLAEDIVARASQTMMPGETLVAHIEAPDVGLREVCESVKSAGDLVQNTRLCLRLWGLVGIYARARGTYTKPSRDAIIKLLVWAQIGARVAYQGLENGAFLSSVGILNSKVWQARSSNWRRWSNRAWLAVVALETLRLLRVRQLKYNEEFGAESADADVDVKSKELKKRWHRHFYANAGWVLPTLYFAAQDVDDQSTSSRFWAGLSGLVPGVIAFQDHWKETA